jgi:hypothetical protein
MDAPSILKCLFSGGNVQGYLSKPSLNLLDAISAGLQDRHIFDLSVWEGMLGLLLPSLRQPKML